MAKMTIEQLKEKQSKSLDWKIQASLNVIAEFYEKMEGQVYIAFSGGKDSTVLLDLVRDLYPDTSAVFANTGIEFPEIVDFVRTFDNVTEIQPQFIFKKVLEKHGYPVISKQVSMGLDRFRVTKHNYQKYLRLHGGINPNTGKTHPRTIPIKYHYLAYSDYKFSEKCCEVFKKRPFHKFEKDTGLHPYIGMMASDGRIRQGRYLQTGCNAFDIASPNSNPLSFWLESDVWEYIKLKKLNYSKIYDSGWDRTGCMYCMFGIYPESKKGLNRFQKMKGTHPKQYDYCINKLGFDKILDLLKVKY